jgi:Fe-S cluster assembly ATPase SufC
MYNTLKNMYIGSYLYDELNHMLYVTSATGKKLTIKKPSELIVNYVKNKYMETGGELKRIEIATVLARGTKLSIFDEPEAGIDLWSFQNLIKVFENMRETVKGTIIVISHQERILNIADEIVVIENGKVKKHGARDEILPELLGTSAAASIACEKLGGDQ